jgi:hypothetical protein
VGGFDIGSLNSSLLELTEHDGGILLDGFQDIRVGSSMMERLDALRLPFFWISRLIYGSLDRQSIGRETEALD